jgi:PKD repeat protein
MFLFRFSSYYLSTILLFFLVTSCVDESIAPVANFSLVSKNTVPPCEVTFTNTSTNSTSYVWEFGDGSVSTSKDTKHTYTKGGEYKVILTATNKFGSNSTYKYSRIALAP